jgi:anaerobic ribonucleoside-triphosphate reductase
MNITMDLDEDFESKLEELKNKYGYDLAKLNGLDDDSLDITRFISNFTNKSVVADASIDPNSNVSRKDMPTLLSEMCKPLKKLESYSRIYAQIKEDEGVDVANEWLQNDYDGHLYMHDASSSAHVHYCFAYDLKDLAEKGLYFLDDGTFNAQPPQHLETFIDFVKEFISFACNRSSGAVGLPNLIPYMFYFWKKDCESGYSIHDNKYFAKQQIQRFIYAVNQPYTRDGIQSAFTNTSVFDHPYFEAIFGGAEFPDGSFMIDYEEEIIEFQKIFLETMADIRSQNMMTFPVNTISLLYQNGKFVDEEFARYAVEHNRKWNDSNLFTDSSVNSLSNCCRLKSNIKDVGILPDKEKYNALGFANSIGGAALKVGSVKVSTVNLARLALECKTQESYLKKLREIVYLDCIALNAVREIIKHNVYAGLLPNFTNSLVDFEHLYNTVGFIGVYEALKAFDYVEVDPLGNAHYTSDGCEFAKKIFEVIHDTSDQYLSDNFLTYHINCEQSPAENAASNIMKKDQFFFGDEVIDDLPLYGNQFMPLGIKTSLDERIKTQALFDSFCNGGSILHINIDAPFDSFDKAWKLTNYVASKGVTYFAFNPEIKVCKHNHGFYGNVCPTCGGEVAGRLTRVVGFFTRVDRWAKPRRQEFKLRRWENVNNLQR